MYFWAFILMLIKLSYFLFILCFQSSEVGVTKNKGKEGKKKKLEANRLRRTFISVQSSFIVVTYNSKFISYRLTFKYVCCCGGGCFPGNLCYLFPNPHHSHYIFHIKQQQQYYITHIYIYLQGLLEVNSSSII